MKQILFLSAMLLIMFSCKKAEVDCVDTDYTFETDVLPIMKTSCNTTGCHNSGSSNGDFTTYANLKPFLDNDQFNQRVFVIGDMPKNRLITFKKKSILQCWMENNYKEK